jgi:hypothetical protein
MEFNYQILVGVMFIDGKPILHVIDAATSLQAARFLRNISAKGIWDTLRLALIDTYLEPPDTLVSDAGTNFTSAEIKANAHIMAIEIEEVPVEAHNSIGKLKRYHAPLRRAFHVIADDLRGQGVSNENILQMAVKAVNDTAGPDGLVSICPACVRRISPALGCVVPIAFHRYSIYGDPQGDGRSPGGESQAAGRRYARHAQQP